MCLQSEQYSTHRNKRSPTLINFWSFSHGERVMVDPGLLGDVRQGQLYLQLDAIDEFDKIW